MVGSKGPNEAPRLVTMTECHCQCSHGRPQKLREWDHVRDVTVAHQVVTHHKDRHGTSQILGQATELTPLALEEVRANDVQEHRLLW